MNNIDKNQAIGLVLISAMLIAYFTFFADNTTPKEKYKEQQQAMMEAGKQKLSESNPTPDSAQLRKQYGDFSTAALGVESLTTLENQNIKVTFSNKGGGVKDVLLKNYKTYSGRELYLINNQYNSLALLANTSGGKINLGQLFYTPSVNGNTVSYKLALGEDKFIEHTYTLKDNSFELTYDVKVVGMDQMITDKNLEFNWLDKLQNIEKDLNASRQAANVTYRLMDGTYKSLSETSTDPQEEKIESKINWVTFKHKFFSAGFIATNGFNNGIVKSDVNKEDSSIVKTFSASLFVPMSDLSAGKGNFKYYFGPNKLSIVSDVAPNFNENVYLGWPVINTINRFTIAPLFSFLERFISNYGVIIICMVLLIKALLFPLSFQSYKSMAKMKVLKPELDEIKARVGDDMSAMQQEQMKLYQQVGVNPLSGCIPVLLQMPVLLAMFNFFPNAIELRQQGFLWAEDLSTYDSIINLPFLVPFYGDHVSLFTLLMTASTILYTWYNNQMNVSATGPMLAMSYIMPLVFMFILNSMPAGLSFYYFVSNLVTVGQQFVIKMFVDEKAIRLKLDQNKKTAEVRKPNRFQQRLMEAMEQQKELKKKTSKK